MTDLVTHTYYPYEPYAKKGEGGKVRTTRKVLLKARKKRIARKGRDGQPTLRNEWLGKGGKESEERMARKGMEEQRGMDGEDSEEGNGGEERLGSNLT